jgi:hypothetical protein
MKTCKRNLIGSGNIEWIVLCLPRIGIDGFRLQKKEVRSVSRLQELKLNNKPKHYYWFLKAFLLFFLFAAHGVPCLVL